MSIVPACLFLVLFGLAHVLPSLEARSAWNGHTNLEAAEAWIRQMRQPQDIPVKRKYSYSSEPLTDHSLFTIQDNTNHSKLGLLKVKQLTMFFYSRSDNFTKVSH